MGDKEISMHHQTNYMKFRENLRTGALENASKAKRKKTPCFFDYFQAVDAE